MNTLETVDRQGKPIYYLPHMSTTNNNMDDLEQQVDELLTLCDRLTQSNSRLQGAVKELKTERSTLIEQKGKAMSHIEAMIDRLKSMEESK